MKKEELKKVLEKVEHEQKRIEHALEMMKKDRMVHVKANAKLLDQIKELFPETRGLTYTGVVDFSLRLLIKSVLKELEAKEG